MDLSPAIKQPLSQMKDKINQIEKLALELSQLGRGVPMIEKNCRNIISTTYVLKFGITDIVDIDNK